jgi:hypothetical protein
LSKVEATLRDIRLDGQRLPVLSDPMQDLLGCAAIERAAVAATPASVRSSAANLIARVLAH